MPVDEEAKKELRQHLWLCDESYDRMQKVKEYLWKIEADRAKRYGRTEPIAAKADEVMWGVRKQIEGLIDIREKLEEEDPPNECQKEKPTRQELTDFAVKLVASMRGHAEGVIFVPQLKGWTKEEIGGTANLLLEDLREDRTEELERLYLETCGEPFRRPISKLEIGGELGD